VENKNDEIREWVIFYQRESLDMDPRFVERFVGTLAESLKRCRELNDAKFHAIAAQNVKTDTDDLFKSLHKPGDWFKQLKRLECTDFTDYNVSYSDNTSYRVGMFCQMLASHWGNR